jgi:hypothetical protein
VFNILVHHRVDPFVPHFSLYICLFTDVYMRAKDSMTKIQFTRVRGINVEKI